MSIEFIQELIITQHLVKYQYGTENNSVNIDEGERYSIECRDKKQDFTLNQIFLSERNEDKIENIIHKETAILTGNVYGGYRGRGYFYFKSTEENYLKDVQIAFKKCKRLYIDYLLLDLKHFISEYILTYSITIGIDIANQKYSSYASQSWVLRDKSLQSDLSITNSQETNSNWLFKYSQYDPFRFNDECFDPMIEEVKTLIKKYSDGKNNNVKEICDSLNSNTPEYLELINKFNIAVKNHFKK